MAENNGKSMEIPALRVTIPEKLGKCFLYFPSHCNVFVHFCGHHCKGTPPEKMRNYNQVRQVCRRAKGSGRAVVTGLSTGTVTQTAWLKSHAPRKKTFIFTYARCPENYSWQFNIWKKLCKSSQQDLLKLVARGNTVKGTLMTGKAQTARTLLNGLCSFQVQNVGQALACSTGA